MASGRYTEVLTKVVHFSKAEAMRLGNSSISPDHLMLGIIRERGNDVVQLLIRHGVDLEALRDDISRFLREGTVRSLVSMNDLSFDTTTQELFVEAYNEAQRLSMDEVNEFHLMWALLRMEKNQTCRSLTAQGVNCERLMREAEEFSFEIFGGRAAEQPSSAKSKSEEAPEGSEEGRSYKLADFCIDLTQRARDGELDPTVGRLEETERMVQILCRRRKNNPILVGDPGVGKSAIVEGLASRIVSGDVPVALSNRVILMLDMAAVVAGTKFRGEFEERMKFVLDELKAHPSYIIYIDEIHTIVGAGSASGTLDAANILKPALSRGDVQCIGATTLDEYRNRIESDGALERRFQRVLVEPSSPEETLTILRKLKSRYEEYHGVSYTDEAVQACVRLTLRYISDRALPDKAVDALDESGARAAIQSNHKPRRIVWLEGQKAMSEREYARAQQRGPKEQEELHRRRVEELGSEVEGALDQWFQQRRESPVEVNAAMVADTVSLMAGVPVQRVAQAESDRLMRMEDELGMSVVGQKASIEAISRAIRRNRSGIKDPRRPIGTFLFLGPTGVGKTYLAKELARYLFDSDKSFIRVDMSEYMEGHSISRLIGSPPGYVGYGEGGQLTEQVRRHPYSVVLFDELEKAAHEVYNLLLQVLDEGVLTDGNGRRVDFTNTIIIMTSNVGSRELRAFGDGVGYMTRSKSEGSEESRQQLVRRALDRQFPPEFLNRVDELVFFRELTMTDMPRILDVHMRQMVERLRDQGLTLRLTPRAKEYILEQGYNPQYGARPLKRAVQRNVEDPVAELLLRGELQAGDTVVLNFSKNKGVYAVAQPAQSTCPVVESEQN